VLHEHELATSVAVAAYNHAGFVFVGQRVDGVVSRSNTCLANVKLCFVSGVVGETTRGLRDTAGVRKADLRTCSGVAEGAVTAIHRDVVGKYIAMWLGEDGNTSLE